MTHDKEKKDNKKEEGKLVVGSKTKRKCAAFATDQDLDAYLTANPNLNLTWQGLGEPHDECGIPNCKCKCTTCEKEKHHHSKSKDADKKKSTSKSKVAASKSKTGSKKSSCQPGEYVTTTTETKKTTVTKDGSYTTITTVVTETVGPSKSVEVNVNKTSTGKSSSTNLVDKSGSKKGTATSLGGKKSTGSKMAFGKSKNDLKGAQVTGQKVCPKENACGVAHNKPAECKLSKPLDATENIKTNLQPLKTNIGKPKSADAGAKSKTEATVDK